MPSRFLASLCVALGLTGFWGAAPGASAQTPASPPPAGGYAPTRGQSGKDVVWIATPDAVVDRMLQMAEVGANDRLVDLGSGDGKIAIAAARNHGARAVGLEFNPQMVELSNQRARDAGVADRVSFQRADIFATDFSNATVVTMYLLPELNLRLRPKLFALPPGTRIVSHSFPMGDWQPDESARSGTGQVYLWRIPANASGQWRVTADGMPNAPDGFHFTQKFQEVRGDVSFGALSADLIRPHLSGSTLTFEARDATGAIVRFNGRVLSDRIVGSATRGTAAPAVFEAVRTDAAQPIAGIGAGAQQ
jgi:hypothetical protein